MKTNASLLVGILAAGALTAGCSFGDSTTGDHGKVEFSYIDGCFMGCGTDQPMLSSSKERISMTGPGNDAGVSVVSLDPKIAELSVTRDCSCEKKTSDNEASGTTLPPDGVCPDGFDEICDNYLNVTTHAQGDVGFEVHDAQGGLIDSTTLHVRPATRITLESEDIYSADTTPVTSLELAKGDTALLRANAYYGVEKLVGAGGFSWSTTDAKVLGIDASDGSPAQSLKALTAGNASLSVSVDGTSATFDVVVK
jgi:hypothetical protein